VYPVVCILWIKGGRFITTTGVNPSIISLLKQAKF
jgi:hypothetical protein